MGRQALEGELMHSQPQDGMCCRLQAAASFAGEMGDEEVQAALPAHNVGDREGDLAGVPAGRVCTWCVHPCHVVATGVVCLLSADVVVCLLSADVIVCLLSAAVIVCLL